jgi:lysophospholipid acyltransferase (LPLAT)-like uncharacterized protein
MKWDRTIRRLTPFLAWVALLGVRLLARTWRLEVHGREPASGADGPSVFAFWHSRLYPCAHHLATTLGRRGVPLAAFVSLSRDGEITARLAQGLGLRVVRGSTSRAGLEGLRRLQRMMREGVSVLTAPDGPRGPALRARPGVVILAQTARAPLVPVAAAAAAAWRLASWDRLIVPKPFTRVAIVFGEAVRYERGCDLEAETAALASHLDRALEVAERAVASGG